MQHILELIPDGPETGEAPAGPRPYRLRAADGTTRRIVLDWSPALLAELAATQAGDAEAGARLGERLRALFADGWDAAAKALERGELTRLTLRSGARELYALPWELMPLQAGGSALAAIEAARLSYASPGVEPKPEVPAPRHAGGRVLFAWSEAGGAVPWQEHLAALREACAAGGVPFDDSDVVGGASLDALHAALRPEHAALHLLAHGGNSGGISGLWLDGIDGPVDPATLADALRPRVGQLRLVVLCACHGGDGGALVSALGSPAWRLHTAGFEAVIASRFPLSKKGSARFASVLWTGLFEQLRDAGDALAQARPALRRLGGLDYAALQLYGAGSCRPVVWCPFPGLRPFTTAEARFFAGRDAEVAALWDKLAAPPRFVVLSGASGTGKTSLLLAGLAPRAAQAGWTTAVVRPGREALAAIESALSGLSGQQALLVVDELEEALFAGCPEAELAAALRRLWEAAAAGPAVVVSLRIDALARLGATALAAELRLDRLVYDETHSLLAPIPARAQLREAMAAPAQKVGLIHDDGLIERILDEVGEEPTALVLIQHVLEALWRRREGPRLTHAAYTALGGVAGALSGEAERVAAAIEAKGPGAARALRRVLVALVSPDSNARRRRSPEALRAQGGAEADGVIEALQDAALITVTPQSVELAHEALIRRWPGLRRWVEEDRARQAELERINAWTADFLAHNSLLDPGRLGYAEEVAARYPEALSPEALALVAASRARISAEAEAERERQRAIALALSQARDTLRIHALGSFGQDATTRAALLRDIELPERLPRFTDEAVLALNQPIARAVLRWPGAPFAAVAWSPDGARVAAAGREGVVIGAADGRGEPKILPFDGDLRDMIWSAEGLLVATDAAAVSRLDGEEFRSLLPPLEGWFQAIALTQGALALLQDGRLRLRPFDGALGPPKGPKNLESLARSPSGARLLARDQDGALHLLDAAGKALQHWKTGVSGWVWGEDEALWLLDEDNTLRCGSRSLTLDERFAEAAMGHGWLAENAEGLRFWRGEGGGPVGQVRVRPELLLWSPKEPRLLTAERHGALRVWGPPPEARVLALPPIRGNEPEGGVGAAFSADGRRLVVWSGGGIRAWSLQEPALVFQREEPPGGAGEDLCFWAGERLLVREADSKLRALWPKDDSFTADDSVVAIDGAGRRALRAPAGDVALVGADGVETARAEGLGAPVRAAAFSADGRRLAVIDAGGDVRVWSSEGERVQVGTLGHGKMAAMAGIGTGRASVAFTGDGGRIAVLTGQSEVSVYPVGPGAPLRLGEQAPDLGTVSRKRAFVAQSTVRTAAAWLAAGFRDDDSLWILDSNGTLRVWRVSTDPAQLRAALEEATTATLSPDDRRGVFGETAAEAQERYASDEARFGRSGAPPPAPLLAKMA